MTADRVKDGLLLFLDDKVRVKLFVDGDYQFEVKGNEKDPYLVEWDGESWHCICRDYYHRSSFSEGSFACKHIHAAIFKLFSLMIVDMAYVGLDGYDK